ncbi:MAG TPA: hypothetical protein VJY62_21820 [Bacteroidia bacterium]|nr:hypothetical protein [Bacteroidia bacterium]
MEYLLTFFYAFVFLLVIVKSSFFKSEKVAPKYFGYVFILKIFAGILLGYLYQIYFNGGDTYVFFNDANKMFATGKSHPVDFLKMLFGLGDNSTLDIYYNQLSGWNNYEYFYNDSKTIIRINAVIRIFTFGYYNVHVVFFCFLSLVGLNGLFKIFSKAFPGKEKLIFISVFLLPSVLFWTSGILKEGILVFALGIFLYSFTKMVAVKPSVKHILSFGISVLILVYLKIYTLMMIVPGMAAYWWCVKTKNKNCFIKFSAVYLLYFIILFNLKYLNPNYNLAEIIYWKQHNSIGYAKFMNSGSFAEPPLLNPNVQSIIKNAPHSLLNTFILPNWNYIHNPFALVAALENLFIILVIFFSIFFSSRIKDEQKPVFYLSLFFVVFLFTLIGLTTPLIGSMVRYKVPALPFLLSMLVMMLNKEKISRWWIQVQKGFII